MRSGGPLLLVLALLAGTAAAAPETSLLPRARPFVTMPMPVGQPIAVAPAAMDPAAAAPLPNAPLAAASPPAALPTAAPLPTVVATPSGTLERPMLRPRARPAQPPAMAEAPAAIAQPQVATIAPEPAPRRGLFGGIFGKRNRETSPPSEPTLLAGAVRPNPSRDAVISRKGAVCGDPAIKGKTLASIPGKLRGCGVAEPVQVTSVDGVQLSMAATMDCTTARALKTWVQTGLKPAFGRNDVVGLQVAAHYSCRSQNNRKGAPISEHGRGKAIDISGIILADGAALTVEGDWRRRAGKAIKAAYKAGCGIFATTLGPGSDGYHEDHMHFDTADRRNKSVYCR